MRLIGFHAPEDEGTVWLNPDMVLFVTDTMRRPDASAESTIWLRDGVEVAVRGRSGEVAEALAVAVPAATVRPTAADRARGRAMYEAGE